MAENFEEMFKDRSIDDLYEMRGALDDYIKREKSRLEEEKARKIAEGLSIYKPVYFLVGKGKEAHAEKGEVVQLTPKSVTAVTSDGRRVTRRYNKLLSQEQAKEKGLQK
jgi:uncharacterized protein YegL